MIDLRVPTTDVLLSLDECAALLRTSVAVLLEQSPLDDAVTALLAKSPESPALSPDSIECWRELLGLCDA